MFKLRKRAIYAFALLLLIVSFNENVYAFGVSYSYLCPENPVIVNPGEETKVGFGLQNMNVREGEDVNVVVRIKNDEGIASLENDKYLVKANTKDTKVFVDLKIPEDAEIGKSYNVVLDFIVNPRENAQGVVFGLGNEVRMCVLVGEYKTLSPEETRAKNLRLFLLGLGILIVLAIIVIIILRRKNREKYKGWQRGRWGR